MNQYDVAVFRANQKLVNFFSKVLELIFCFVEEKSELGMTFFKKFMKKCGGDRGKLVLFGGEK